MIQSAGNGEVSELPSAAILGLQGVLRMFKVEKVATLISVSVEQRGILPRLRLRNRAIRHGNLLGDSCWRGLHNSAPWTGSPPVRGNRAFRDGMSYRYSCCGKGRRHLPGWCQYFLTAALLHRASAPQTVFKYSKTPLAMTLPKPMMS